MLYDRIANNQSQKRYTMDSLKEKAKPTLAQSFEASRYRSQ